MYGRARDERGQSTVEWIALVLLVALLALGLMAAVGAQLPGAGLARTIAAKLICAVRLDDTCAEAPELVAEYGVELAGLVREHAPSLIYEEGMYALPVDYRSCREPACSVGPGSGLVWRSDAGEPVVAFVHVIDCRPQSMTATTDAGHSCADERQGNLYLQYWFYYPDSATLRGMPVAGERGYHLDDWESLQVRLAPDGTADVRASSHHGYNYELGRANWASDAGLDPAREATEVTGIRPDGGWGPETGYLFVSGGSHAGNAKRRRLAITRLTPAERLVLIPVEPIAAGEGDPATFAVTPPWLKAVWGDPESDET